jgi:hypothetical protein
MFKVKNGEPAPEIARPDTEMSPAERETLALESAASPDAPA